MRNDTRGSGPVFAKGAVLTGIHRARLSSSFSREMNYRHGIYLIDGEDSGNIFTWTLKFRKTDTERGCNY